MAVRKDDAPAGDQAAITNVAWIDGFFRRRWIDSDHLRLTQAAGAVAPTSGVLLASLLVDNSAVTTEFNGLTAVAPIRRHEPDGAVAVPVVVPVHECADPAASLCLAAEGPPGVIRPVFHGAEQRLRVGWAQTTH